jgi:glycerol-3-phosphate dehydrogenase (NAD(P)+)
MKVSVLGAGAFGTALAIALSRDGTAVTLWGRDQGDVEAMQRSQTSGQKLPNFPLPESLTVTTDDAAFDADVCLLTVPAQKLVKFVVNNPISKSAKLISCAKGIDRKTGLGPVATLKAHFPDATAGILTGPSFAVDIAKGLPTALVLASARDEDAQSLQSILTRPTLRLYRTTDVTGAELGGALKNVVALAAGITIGAGLGDSARASVVARGFAELNRFSEAKGAKSETIQGLSGLGDLVLTATSEKSRNYTTGLALGKGETPDDHATVEGLATAPTILDEARRLSVEVPLIETVAHVVSGHLGIEQAIEALLSRPVGKE